MKLWRVHVIGGPFASDQQSVALVWPADPDDADRTLQRVYGPPLPSHRDPDEPVLPLACRSVEPYDNPDAAVLIATRVEPGTEADRIYRGRMTD
jgi:hypothetical protein